MRFWALLSLLLVFVASQTYQTFKTPFIATAPQWGTGYFTGTFEYDWTLKKMRISFDNADGYSELYVFNTDGGYNTASLTGQFTYQYLYKTSNTCPCETNGLQYGMPAFYIDANPLATTSPVTKLPFWTNPTDNTDLKRTDTTTKYFSNFNFVIPINGNQQAYYLANAFWVDKSDKPAGMIINDFQQRTFTFTDVQSVTSASLSASLQPPASGCKCAKLLDLVISLDRSGSIQVSQWRDELAFTKNLTAAFEYGPNKCNVGITNWNAAQWDTLDITSGTSDPVVKSTVNSMTCCGTPPATTGSCCCCGTPIGGGLWAAGNMMLKSARTTASKVIAILTDGCQNHLWDPLKTPKATSCGCASEQACATNTTCTDDITKWFNWIKKNIPGTKVISIGVGTSATICPKQLLLAAGNDPTMVFNPQSWADLITIVQTISATACTSDNVLCPGCCGICTCGVCYAPTKCFDQDQCNKGAIPQGSQCCGVDPVICTPPPCYSAVCDPAKGCQYNRLTCKAATLCSEWFCDNTTVYCQQRPIVPTPQGCGNKTVVPQCDFNSDCNDRTNCTTDACVAGKCINTQVICPASTNCSFTTCKPTVGCYTTNRTCNDYDACTIDSCDPNVLGGCVFKNITCPKTTDPCFYAYCHSEKGCVNASVACNLTVENCTVPACNQTCYLKYNCDTPGPTGEENAPPTTVILASTLTTAAIAGIVCGAVILAAGVGAGGAVAVAGGAGAGGVTAVFSNPVYAGTATEGQNPLNKT